MAVQACYSTCQDLPPLRTAFEAIAGMVLSNDWIIPLDPQELAMDRMVEHAARMDEAMSMGTWRRIDITILSLS